MASSAQFLPRCIFGAEHEAFREAAHRFVAREIVPHHARWEEAGQVPRDLWRSAGEAGLLCCSVPEKLGGPGADLLYSVILMEELMAVGASGPGFWLHSEIVAPYLLNHGTDEQRRRWLPPMVRGDIVAGIAMTEPGAGSDLQGIRTQAARDRDTYVLNGQKVFITNGQLADLFVVVVRTDAARGSRSLSLLLVEADRPGFRRGRNLRKLGYHAQDTSELFFDEVRVPAANLLGAEGQGLPILMSELPRERLLIASYCQARAESAYRMTVDYARERRTFGRPIVEHQHVRFKLAELKTALIAGRAFVDRLLALQIDGGIDTGLAAAAKLHATELLGKVVDECLQLHGGWGYMWELPIARAYADARVERIAGGTSEMMKELIGRDL